MSSVTQIMLGSLLLFGCILIHLIILSLTISHLRRRIDDSKPRQISLHYMKWLAISLGSLVISHTIQIWIMAGSVRTLGALSDFPTSLYFSLVTYTALGYGDVILSEGYRLFGAFGSVIGLLAFGLSTAFLVGLFTRIMPNEFT